MLVFQWFIVTLTVLGIWEDDLEWNSKPFASFPFSDPEAKILDYQTQQQKLLPQLAMSYAFHFLATKLLEFFHSSYNAILNRDFSLLPEVFCLMRATAGGWLMLFSCWEMATAYFMGPQSHNVPGHHRVDVSYT